MKDKRSVHTDALATLGTIITDKEKRDAIHLAVIPMQAKGRLMGGEPVNQYGIIAGGVGEHPVGIVDPFLENGVKPGEWFWCLIYPRTIKSLRHVWEHPAFPDELSPTPNNTGLNNIAFGISALEPISNGKEGIMFGSFRNSLEESKIEKSIKWMQEYAAQLGYGDLALKESMGCVYTIENVLDAADNYLKNGKITSIRGDEDDVPDEFWDHYEIIKGKKVHSGNRDKFFSCVC